MKGDVIEDAALLMDQQDSVATALEDLESGRVLNFDSGKIVLADRVPFGHKFALGPIERGEDIYKYGAVIGRATADVPSGTWVHTHNCESTRGRGDQEETK
ncbi:altronate dehydratase small subunit [Haladaptatus litoreus]|uniref:Altronate dehydratase small subunit n=1 Tax=Haladaptatus litoreus TaxID=553468 RepID=A0A1N7DHQ7_9EURY|nr:UxaA family hydrolase [Haladaptatus litoreus]SIR75328.1 altronate dehydratase small subunit [Haladaptatus litoreus]